VLLAEAVLEEDLKRLRLRCELRCGRGMVGLQDSGSGWLEGCVPGSALFLGRLQAIETRPPIVGDRRGLACSKSAMPSGKPVTLSGTAATARLHRHRQREAASLRDAWAGDWQCNAMRRQGWWWCRQLRMRMG